MTTDISRIPELQVRDRAALDALLDEIFVGHIGVVAADGTPLVVPTAVARDGDQLLIHGSTGSPWLRRVAAGAPVSVAVTALDGLVFARSAFESSMRYRSAVLFGRCALIADPDEKLSALRVLTEAFMPGRVDEVRESTRRELAATVVLALPIERWSLKVSAGWPEDPPSDVAGPAWAGVLPIRVGYGPPLAAPDLREGIETPPSIHNLRASRPAPPPAPSPAEDA